MDKNQEVTHFIESAIPEHRKILEELRWLIEESNPNVTEQFKWKRPVYATKKDFSYLATTKSHVTLGFNNFEKVDDPENLLEGTGAQMRHVKISSVSEIRKETLSNMLKQASKFE